VWKDFLRKQIEELRAQEKQLNEQLAGNNQLIMKGILDKGEYNKEKASLKAQIAETQKEIQAKEAKLSMPGGGKTTAALMVLKMLKEVFEYPCLFQFGSIWVWIPKQFPQKGEVEVFDRKENANQCLLTRSEGKVFNFIDPQCGENPIADLDNQLIIHIGWVSPKRASLLRIQERDMDDLFNYKAHKRIIFPTWVSEEIKDCRSKCYAGLDESVMINRMKKWGPSPRYIFESSEDNNVIIDLVNNVTKEQLQEFFYSSHSAEAFTSGRLVHMVPQNGGDLGGKYYFRFASAYVSNLFRQKYKTYFIEMARYKVSAAARVAIDSHEYADWLERLTTIHFTKKRGIFKPTKILKAPDEKTGPDFEVDLKNMGHEYFTQKNFQDCEFKLDTYYEPSWRNLESIDSLFIFGSILYLIQITFSQRHPVETAGIGAVWNAARKKQPELKGYVLIFVLPEGSSRGGKNYVKDFVYQSYVKFDGTVVEYGNYTGFPQLRSELGQYLFVLPGVFTELWWEKGDLIP